MNENEMDRSVYGLWIFSVTELFFRGRFIFPPDNNWGNPLANGSVTGMIGVIARREAHMAIDMLTVTGNSFGNMTDVLKNVFYERIFYLLTQINKQVC